MTERDDSRLIERVAAGDRPAFAELYRRYHRRLFAYVHKLTRRPETVEEVVDDVLLAVWRGAGTFDGRSRVSTWILGIAYRQAMKALGRRPAEEPVPDELPAPADEDPERTTARHELAETVGRALGALSPEQRAVVVLTYYFGYSYPEIGRIVGCPVGTVKTRMFHARRRLRAALPCFATGEAGGDDRVSPAPGRRGARSS